MTLQILFVGFSWVIMYLLQFSAYEATSSMLLFQIVIGVCKCADILEYIKSKQEKEQEEDY